MRQSNRTKKIIVILGMLAIVLLACIEYTTDIWNFGTFICQLLAVIELVYGLQIAEMAQTRKRSYRLLPEDRHAYAQHLYEKQYDRYPILANQVLFVMAQMDIQMRNYERAEEELGKICIEKCKTEHLKLYYYLKPVVSVAAGDGMEIDENRMRYLAIPDAKGGYPPVSELDLWIKQGDIVQMTEVLQRVAPDKKEHLMRICIITVILTYSTAFYGLWYGINRNIGYEVRQHFAEISAAFITISLAFIIIWGIVSIYRRNCQELSAQSDKTKATLMGIYGAAAIFALIIIGSLGFNVFLGTNWTETETEKSGKYTYITVKEDYGNVYRYRTNNPFIMRSVDSLLPSSNIVDENEDEEKVPDSNTGTSANDSDIQNKDQAQDDTSEYQKDGLTIQNEMLAVYNYLQEQNTLQNMAFSYTANVKGEIYAVISKVQEEKDGNMVTVQYCLYDNGEKKDLDGNSCEELVLEKVYPEGNYEKELVDFYLVNADTMQVTDEQKDTW